ncbi:MAG: trypsin-like peptidase domain-containing protein [Vicinamibacterales bacterium]
MATRLTLATLLLLSGLAAGLVLSGEFDLHQRAAASLTTPAAGRPGDDAARVADPDGASGAQGPAPRALVAGPDFTAVAAKAVDAVANISSVQVVRQRTSPFFNDPFFQDLFGDMDGAFGGRDRYASSLGSGVIVSADGYVVTNFHVIGEGRIAEVTVSLADRREFKATVVGVDPDTDIALLKVDATGLPVIPWGDSTKLRVAEWVLAIGNPYQLNQSVSLGIVSALGRSNVGLTNYEDFIQTDAAINPGNSGGALVNASGQLVGINTAIFSQSGGYQGIGFAVPSALVRRIVDDLVKYGEVRRGSIGYLQVAPLNSRLATQLDVPQTDGVLITGMAPKSPADRAGVEPGDVIVAVDGQAIRDTSQLIRVIADAPIGGTITIDVVREGRRQTFTVDVERQRSRRRNR